MAYLSEDPGFNNLLSILQASKNDFEADEGDINFLGEVLNSRELQALVLIHNKVSSIVGKSCLSTNGDARSAVNGKQDSVLVIPTLSNSSSISFEVMEGLQNVIRHGGSREAKELYLLLQRPILQCLLEVHDAIAQKDYVPKLPELPFEVDEDEETVKIVQLVKSNEPLALTAEPIVGATIKSDDITGKIIIARVMHGGAADRSGLIHPGDEILEVNGIDVLGKTPNDVLDILKKAEGTITFKLVPADNPRNGRENRVRVRAFFTFNPAVDPYIPCKEAGLDFVKGDILHIVSQDDPYWWQARKEGDEQMRAGLIPSRMLQEKRIAYERAQRKKDVNSEEEGLVVPGSVCWTQTEACPPPKSRTKKIMYALAEHEDFDREEIATYEEVAKLLPNSAWPRPIVLIGPPGVGRNELKRRLMALDPDKFKTTIPYTSRAPKVGEIDGVDYHFVSREQMEQEIEQGLFIEYGEFKGNLYGTAARSVKEITEAGATCILNPHHQALKILRTAEFKPHVVYVKPPTFDELKLTRSTNYARSTFDENNSRGFTDDELHEMLRFSQRIEYHYDHLFDDVIVNGDLSSAFDQLLAVTDKVEKQTLWAPLSWVV